MADAQYRVNINLGAAGIIPARSVWAAGDTPQFLRQEMAGAGGLSYAIGISSADHGGTVRAATYLDYIGGLNEGFWVMSDLTYTFQLQALPGQTPADTVPVTVLAGAKHLFPGSFVYGNAIFSLRQSGQQGYEIYKQAYTQPWSPAYDLFSVNQVVNMVPGLTYTVYLYAQLDAHNTTANQGTFTPTSDELIVDPVFTIDPAYASQYQLVGIPSAPVPEPASALLMTLGGAALLGLRRRNRLGSA